MMAFMTALLRFFVAVGIALTIIAGGVSGWFYDALPAQSVGAPAFGAATPVTRAIAALVGCLAGLFAATMSFGVLALLLDIRDRLVAVAEQAAGGRRV